MTAALDQLMDEILIPLVNADGGTIEVVSAEEGKVVFHLGGACTGCPGVHYTRNHVIVPLVRKALGTSVTVEVSNTKVV